MVKKMYIFLLLFVNGIIHNCCGLSNFHLNGKDWVLSQEVGNITVTAQVPGSVYTDLFRGGVIGDPYYRFNDLAYSWIGYSDWTYSKKFSVGNEVFQFKQHLLEFEGLDTIAVVTLNDVVIGNASNMFRRYVFNVTELLKTGDNKLVVQFKSAVLYAKRRAEQYPYPVPPGCPPPEQKGECHFNFIRKQAASFSWDWGPSFPTLGIWKNVSLISYNTAVMSYVTTETSPVNSSLWELSVSVFFHGIPNGWLNVNISELGVFHHQPVSFKSASEPVRVVLNISEVKMWWPNGYGDATLYLVTVSYDDDTSGDFEQKSFHIGFRSVELVQDEVSSGNTFFFKVNGLPIFAKGSNWIPADSFQERIKPSYVEQLLRSAAEANMNMLRVWGGGVYESDDFYLLADKFGLMIWQDFMFACALYPTDSEFIHNVREEITHQVRRLKHHPSIVIWAGNNENEGALANNWFGIKKADYPRYLADYIELYVRTIRSIVLVEDTSRPFVSSSPSNGVETVSEGWVAKDPQSPFYGDIHDYDYSRDSWNWTLYLVPRFASEFGLQSWCSLESLAAVSLPAVDWDVDSTFVSHRQHHGNGESQMTSEVSMHLKLPTSTNYNKYFADFVYLTQINQAVGIKTEVELYRRRQNCLTDGKGLTMGALYWQLNDIWQAPTWASIEYGGKWKMLHYFARKFFNKQLISPYVDGENVTVDYISDGTTHSLADVECASNEAAVVLDSRSTSSSNPYRPNGPRSLRRYPNYGLPDRVSMHMKARSRYLDNWHLITGRCYKWNSFEAEFTWQIKFQTAASATQHVFTSPLRSILASCGCRDISHCFLHFTDETSSAYDSYLFLTNIAAVDLPQTTVKITDVRQIDNETAEIRLTSSGISLFVWLEVSGFSGRFSDNGFLITRPETFVKFHSWTALANFELFQKNLTVRSLIDVYM